MADRTLRMSKPVVALATLGIIGVLVAVWAVYALVRPHGVESDRALPISASPGRIDVREDNEAGIYDPAEPNERLLESAVPSSTAATTSVESSLALQAALPATATPPGPSVPQAGIVAANPVGDAPPSGGTVTSSGTGGDSGSGGSVGSGASYAVGRVYGIVRHEVWGTPLGGATVLLTPGSSGLTGSSGGYSLNTPPQTIGTRVSYTVAFDAARAGLLSHGSTRRTFSLGAGETTQQDFAAYYASESRGTDWRAASWWSGWRGAYGASAMSGLLSKVRAASAELSNVDIGNVDAVLAPRANASARTKARAEYLALWLDLASSRLGFDTPHGAWSIRGWGSGGAGTVLSFARQVDAVFTSGADANWNDVRRVCSGG